MKNPGEVVSSHSHLLHPFVHSLICQLLALHIFSFSYLLPSCYTCSIFFCLFSDAFLFVLYLSDFHHPSSCRLFFQALFDSPFPFFPLFFIFCDSSRLFHLPGLSHLLICDRCSIFICSSYFNIFQIFTFHTHLSLAFPGRTSLPTILLLS